MIDSIDERDILRFASGEMDAGEERDFLTRCELAPETWRMATLAVAEHRRVVAVLREFASVTPARVAGAKRAWRQAALAAGALAAGIVIGIAGTSLRRPSPEPDTILAGPVTAKIIVERPGIERRGVAETGAISPAPEAIDSNAVARQPSVSLDDNESFSPAPIIAEADRELLADRGFEVEEEPTLYIVTAKNGTRWAVPTRRAVMHYSGVGENRRAVEPR